VRKPRIVCEIEARRRWRTEVRRYENQVKGGRYKFNVDGNVNGAQLQLAATESKPEPSARGQKKLPKDVSFGSYAYPRMDKLRFGGALLPA
jgi:hypothetical protein